LWAQAEALPLPQAATQNAAPIVQVRESAVGNRVEEPKEEPADDPLMLFSESLKSGDKKAAANHLETYVRRHPDQVMFQLQLAELLVQTKCDNRARGHYEQFVASAQTSAEPVRRYLVHAHTRLMEIAQRTDDSFAELFHRGVGLLILVREQDRNPDRDDAFCEEMLCKALRILNEAKEQRPGDPRVRIYLAEIQERMGNRRASMNERGAARNGVVPGELTRGEQALLFIRGL
jgi:hypothetical protein